MEDKVESKIIYVADYLFGKVALNTAIVREEDVTFYSIYANSVVNIFGEKLATAYIPRGSLHRHVEETLPAALKWLDEHLESSERSLRVRIREIGKIRDALDLIGMEQKEIDAHHANGETVV